MHAFYFGCMHQSGHHMHAAAPQAWREASGFLYANPWGTSVDGGLCPKGRQTEGLALLHRKADWTALSFWDRSVDTRQGSCSTFLLEGRYSFDEALRLARQNFPAVMARYRFAVQDAATTVART